MSKFAQLGGVIRNNKAWSALMALLSLIGLGGLPDDIVTWQTWLGSVLATLSSGAVRWLALLGAIAILFGLAYRDRIIPPFSRWVEGKSELEKRLAVLQGTKAHILRLLGGSGEYDETTIIAAGNAIQQAREVGAFDDQIQLLNIMRGIDKHEYQWQSGNAAIDTFHGFWFWLKDQGDPGFEVRGDYQPYALKTLAKMLSEKIEQMNQ